jgi:hypothetical protein
MINTESKLELVMYGKQTKELSLFYVYRGGQVVYKLKPMISPRHSRRTIVYRVGPVRRAGERDTTGWCHAQVPPDEYGMRGA